MASDSALKASLLMNLVTRTMILDSVRSGRSYRDTPGCPKKLGPHIHNSVLYLGELGAETGIKDTYNEPLCIGDIVLVEVEGPNNKITALTVIATMNGRPGILGIGDERPSKTCRVIKIKSWREFKHGEWLALETHTVVYKMVSDP
jgi:hypothetical protein